jgi:ABC-type transport system involved in cytochrome c biogenesis ATPase subunit
MGWRQRVRLARLLVQPHTLWLLDRPILYLDETGRNMAETLIAGRCQQNGIVIFSHDGETRLNPHGSLGLDG